MSATVAELLETFDRLAVEEKREAAHEILRRTTQLDLEPLSDAALTEVAEEAFLRLEREEAADG